MTNPIWSPRSTTFTIAQRNHDLDAHNARVLARIALEADPDAELKASRPTIISHLGCERQLRGIPVVGAPGVGGAIHGTRPGNPR